MLLNNLVSNTTSCWNWFKKKGIEAHFQRAFRIRTFHKHTKEQIVLGKRGRGGKILSWTKFINRDMNHLDYKNV